MYAAGGSMAMENKQINSVNEKPTRSQGANLKDKFISQSFFDFLWCPDEVKESKKLMLACL